LVKHYLAIYRFNYLIFIPEFSTWKISSKSTLALQITLAGQYRKKVMVHQPFFGKGGGDSMPIYITLFNLTEQGVKNIKDAPERIKEGIKTAESIGGKLIGFYATMGEYDYISIGEAPSDEVYMTFLLGLGAQGYVRTKTLKAFSNEEFVNMIAKLP
jgi:uncharacterized protein with GYD domain